MESDIYFLEKLIIKTNTFEDSAKGIKAVICVLAGLTCGCGEGSEGKLWDDLLRGGACGGVSKFG